jgi:hypothetical protein
MSKHPDKGKYSFTVKEPNMAAFSKQEIVLFDQALEGFQDALVVSQLFDTFDVDAQTSERASDIIWRPQPYIVQSYNGNDATANFGRAHTQLSVPTSLGFQKHVPVPLTARELRDEQQRERLSKGAMQRLASDVNLACSDLAALSGTIFVKRSTAAVGFDDVAAIDTAFNRLGVQFDGRMACYSSQDYNNMASNLANRGTVAGKVSTAYERATIGMLAGIDTYKMDYAYRLTAAAGVGVTINGANQFYTPRATSTAGTGEVSNVDNRYQTVAITVASGTVKVGDAFTSAGVNEVHHITKADTGSAKTFRITAIVTGAGGTGTVQISPPIISAQGGTDAEIQYRNVTATPAAGAALTFQNTVTGLVNPFWQKSSFCIMPGKLMPDPNAGMDVMSGTTDQGVTVTMTRQATINTLNTNYRFDVLFGLANLQPQMSGVEMFSQT